MMNNILRATAVLLATSIYCSAYWVESTVHSNAISESRSYTVFATTPNVYALEPGDEEYGYILLSQDQVPDYLKDLGDHECTEETVFFCKAGLYDPMKHGSFCFLTYDTSKFYVTFERPTDDGAEQMAEIIDLLGTVFDDSYTVQSNAYETSSPYRYTVSIFDGEHRDVTRALSMQAANALLNQYDNMISCYYQPFCQGMHDYWWDDSITTYRTEDYPNAAEEITALLESENEAWSAVAENGKIHVQPHSGAEPTTEYIRINKLIYDKLGYEVFHMIVGYSYTSWGETNYLEANGDADRNSFVDTVDCIITLQEYNRVTVIGEAPTLTPTQRIAADVDMDGSITTMDALEILRRYTETIG